VVAVVVVVVVAGEVVVVAGAGDVFGATAGEVFVVEAGEVFAAAAGELCPKANPAGRTASRAIAKIGLMRFMETESFYLMQLKEARPEPWHPVGASDIGATRADSYVKTETRGRGSAASILKETLENGNVEGGQ
jgi:hypothetical protein